MLSDAGSQEGQTVSKQTAVLLIAADSLTRLVVPNGLLAYGFEVLVARDGAEAVERLKGGARIDVLVTDADLGGEVDGISAARRARELRPKIEVIYAARVPARVPDRAKVSGAPCLKAPYHPYQLVSVIAALKSRPAADPLHEAA